MQIRPHSVMVRQFVEQHFVRFDHFLPFRGRVVRDREADEVVGEFEAGVGVGVHCCFVLFVLWLKDWDLGFGRDRRKGVGMGYIG